MNSLADFLLAALIVAGLYMVATSRLGACVRASAVQGIILGLLPPALEWTQGLAPVSLHVAALALGAFGIKAIVIPRLLLRSIREAGVRREVEPMTSLHVSVLGAAVLVGVAFWLASQMDLPLNVDPTVGWWNDLPYAPVHGGARNHLYFDWHVAAVRAVTETARQ